MKGKILLILINLSISIRSFFFVDLNSGFLLTATPNNITTIDPDLLDYYLVGFQDATARRYSSDFSSYTSLVVPQIVDKFIPCQLQLAGLLVNGLLSPMLTNITATLSNNYSTLRAYSYPAFSHIQSWNFTQAIIYYNGVSVASLLNTALLHIVVLNQSITVIYKNTQNVAFNLVQTFGSGAYCTSATLKQSSSSTLLGIIYLSYAYFQTITGVGLIQVNIVLTLNYNLLTLSYDLSISSTYTTLSNVSGYFITSMMMANGILLMQAQGGGLFLHTSTATSTSPYLDSFVLSNPIFNFYYSNATYYILYSSGLVSVAINTIIAQFLGSISLITLPSNTYHLSFGSILDVLYIPRTPYIYKTICPNETYDNGFGSCVSYNCAVTNCIQCQLTVNTCGICDIGYKRNDNLTCIFTNETNATNTTSNTSKNNINIMSLSRFYSLFPVLVQMQWIQNIFWMILNFTKDTVSIPAIRKLSPFFYYFGNFDDLYLYMFHDRLYGNTMNELFTEVNEIQIKKWNFFNYGHQLNLFNIRNQSFFAEIVYQDSYLTYNFTSADHTNVGSEGLLYNCINFFVVSMPITLAAFILLRKLFHLLFQFHVSRLFRKFDLWGYLFLILFDGNVQQFAFYLTVQLKNTFFFSSGDKLLKTGIIWFGFLLVAVSVGGFLIGLGTYCKLNRHLIDNNRNTLAGNSYILLQCGFRNLILGFFHSAMRFLPYEIMLSILIITEILFFLVFVISITMTTYRMIYSIWVYIILTFIRILIIFTLFFDYVNTGQPIVEIIQCVLIVIMIIVYLLGTLIIALAFIIQLLRSVIKICRKPSEERYVSESKISSANSQTEVAYYIIKLKTNEIVPSLPKIQKKSRFSQANKFKRAFNLKMNALKCVYVATDVMTQQKTNPLF